MSDDWFSNKTRYNSDDLKALCELIFAEMIAENWTYNQQDRTTKKVTKIPITLRREVGFRQGKLGHEEGIVVCARPKSWKRYSTSIIELAAPRAVMNRAPLEFMARSGTVPKDGVLEIIAAYVHVVTSVSYQMQEFDAKSFLQKLLGKLTPLPDIRIEKGAKNIKRQLTLNESLERMKSAYKPGKDKVAKWVGDKVRYMSRDFVKEYNRLEKWRKKFEAKGGRLAPNEIHYTFSELLQKLAEELK